MGLINTVLGYKKGSKTKNIFSMSENMMFELSNALSIVFISLKLVKIRQVKVLSVAPPKGHESLLVLKPTNGGTWRIDRCFHFFLGSGSIILSF